MSDSDVVHLHASSPVTSSPCTKPVPKSSKVPLVFSYTPSDDGTDENLLILLHGLGDSHTPFAKLGRSLHLPQTAVLALRAPEQIPYLYEQAFQWYTSFDPLGEIIERPNPTLAIEVMAKVFDHLIAECAWPPNRIHLFGFGQGGSVAAETALAWWKRELVKTFNAEQKPVPPTRHLGSVASVSGPLLSYPTLATPCPTPLLIFSRGSVAKNVSTAFSKGFTDIRQVVKQGEESMPRSRDEWEPIMQFWSEVLGRRMGDGLYEVMTGTAA
ncbi:Alpha/Beta hydrolase protein [Boletus coccyginus]|nr:Alpha/Beta hydrolase protein [Boletus coccyginus]